MSDLDVTYDEYEEEVFLATMQRIINAKGALLNKYPYLDVRQIHELHQYRNRLVRENLGETGFEQTLINMIDDYVEDNFKATD